MCVLIADSREVSRVVCSSLSILDTMMNVGNSLCVHIVIIASDSAMRNDIINTLLELII
jgi:hypothetical protein